MTPAKLPIDELVRAAGVVDPTLTDLEGATIVDAIVVFHYQAPDWLGPRIGFTSTPTMALEARIGVLVGVVDRLRDVLLESWSE